MKITQKIMTAFVAFYSAATFANTSLYFNGDKNQALLKAGTRPTMNDLRGRTLMPGFIDSWGHFTLML